MNIGLSSIWPPHFPEGCPPDEATNASDTLFRLVATNPPTEADFLSYYDEDPVKHQHNCRARGLSVFTQLGDAARLVKRVTALGREFNFVASATINEGKLMQTGRPSHHTWWVPRGSTSWKSFAIVE
jgi:hypothetical protein